MSEAFDQLRAEMKALRADIEGLRRQNNRNGIVTRDEQRLERDVARGSLIEVSVPLDLYDTVGSAAAALATAEAYTDSKFATVGTRNLDSQTTLASSQANTNENDLMSYSIPAGKMATNGDVVTCRMVFFTNGAAPATRRIRAYYNGQVIFDTTALAGFTSTTLALDIEIARVSATTQKVVVIAHGDFTVISSIPTRTAGTATLANAIILKATSQQGAGAGAADVAQTSMNTLYTPVAA